MDSNEELYLSWALDELQKRRHIIWYEPQSPQFFLTDSKWGVRREVKKTKIKTEDVQSMQRHVYTPDFMIKWNEDSVFYELFPDYTKNGAPFWAFENKGEDRPLSDIGNGVYSIIEVKPNFDRHNMTRGFKVNQKFIYDKLGVYVQLIKPEILFKNTFTPDRYLYTDKSKKERKIKFKTQSIDEYTKQLKEIYRQANQLSRKR